MNIRYEKSAVKYIKVSQKLQQLVKRLVLAWDPDFTKLTPEEQKLLEAAENGEYIDSRNIDWDK